MSYVIIDKRAGNAEVCCDEYGDYAVFETHEDAESFRSLYCDSQESYVFPRKLCRGIGFHVGIIRLFRGVLKLK